jgi:hypothetical protein
MTTYQALVAQGGEFASILKKWRQTIFKTVQKMAPILEVPEEDVLQDVLTVMWLAYETYRKPQARYNGFIWDVVSSGNAYVLQRYDTRVEVSAFDVEPIDKRMKPASFVFLRLMQWRANIYTLHFTARRGYTQATEKVRIKGKLRQTYFKAVFSESLDTAVDDDLSWSDILVSPVETPEAALQYAELVRDVYAKLDPLARLVLGLFVSAELPLPQCEFRDAGYIAHVLGISRPRARLAFRRLLQALQEVTQEGAVLDWCSTASVRCAHAQAS